MKAIRKIDMLKAIAFIVAAISLFSCTQCDEPNPPVPPVVLTKAIAIIQPATNVKINSATIVAKITPNEDDTKVSFETKETANSNWSSHVLPLSYSGKDTLKVTFDFSDLIANTSYDFRISVINKAGQAVSENNSFKTYAFTDYDGNMYHAVTIGNQTWLQENLKTTHFLNGDPIPNVTDQATWNSLTTPGYCYYNNDSKNAETYGALYNFYVVKDPRGLIAGYHSPSMDEWTTLSNYLGGADVAGGKMKEAGYDHWIKPNAGATNSSGFNGLPSGVRQDTFSNLGDGVSFWSTTIFMGMPNVVFAPDLGQTSALLQLNGGSYTNRGSSIRVIKN